MRGEARGRKKSENEIENEKRPARNQPRFKAERQRLRRVPGIAERIVVFIFGDVLNADTSDVVIALRVSMHRKVRIDAHKPEAYGTF